MQGVLCLTVGLFELLILDLVDGLQLYEAEQGQPPAYDEKQGTSEQQGSAGGKFTLEKQAEP